MLGIYAAYLIIADIPLFIESISLSRRGSENNPYLSIFLGMIVSLHGIYLSYLATGLAIAAICIQARAILQATPPSVGQPSPSPEHLPMLGSVSLPSLGRQCVTLTLLAVTRIFRLSFRVDLSEATGLNGLGVSLFIRPSMGLGRGSYVCLRCGVRGLLGIVHRVGPGRGRGPLLGSVR
jgi:hypothetical protein